MSAWTSGVQAFSTVGHPHTGDLAKHHKMGL